MEIPIRPHPPGVNGDWRRLSKGHWAGRRRISEQGRGCGQAVQAFVGSQRLLPKGIPDSQRIERRGVHKGRAPRA